MALIYTFRGVYGKDLTDDIAAKIGFIVGERFQKEGYDQIIIGGDHRDSTNILKKNIINSFLANNVKILDIGLVPSPVLAYIVKRYRIPGLMITASHNPPEWNGLQFHDPTSKIYGPDWENEIKARLNEDFNLELDSTKLKTHVTQKGGIINEYLNDLISKIKLGNKKLKVVIDSGNGMATTIIPKLLDMLAIDYIEVNSGLDPSFPNRPSAPYIEHLEALKKAVISNSADVGFAYDGDSDRLIVLDDKGESFSGDLITLLFCKELLKPDNIVLSIETSFAVEKELEKIGYKIENCRMGQTFLGEKIVEKDAVFAGEPNGHYTFPYFSYRGDGIASTAYFCQVLSSMQTSLSEINKPLSNMKREKFDWEGDISDNAEIEDYLTQKFGNCKRLNHRLYIGQNDNSRIIFRQSQFDPSLQISVETYDDRLTREYFEEAKRVLF